MAGRLAGRSALVTGASRGIGRAIGRAIAVRLAEEGADIAVNFAHNEAAALEVADAVRPAGRRGELYPAGVADDAEVTRMRELLYTCTRGSENIREQDEHAPFGFVCTPEDIAGTVA